MPELVSILIPCFNCEPYIADAVESALAQDYSDVEVIAFDDGSTDRSADVLRRFERDARFRWRRGPNRGANAARNELLHLARGRYIQFLDADDMLERDKISRGLAAMNDGVDAVTCDYRVVGDGAMREVRLASAGADLVEYAIRGGILTPLPLHRRECLIASGGFDETLECGQEYELHLRLSRRHWRGIEHIPAALCAIRRRPGSVSSSEPKIFRQKVRTLGRAYEQMLRDGALTPARIQAIGEVLHNSGRHLARAGLRIESREAFDLANRIAGGRVPGRRWPMRLLAGAVGHFHAERLRSTICRVLGRTI